MSPALTVEQVERIRASFNAVAPQANALIDTFYTRLFETAPSVRPLFREDMSEHKEHLLGAVKLVATRAHDIPSIESALAEMDIQPLGFGTEPDHYPVVRDTLLDALNAIAGDAWTNEIEEAWTDALNMVAGMMNARARNLTRRSAA